MKSIVVYYSLEGDTDFAAQKIAGLLGADTLHLHSAQNLARKNNK